MDDLHDHPLPDEQVQELIKRISGGIAAGKGRPAFVRLSALIVLALAREVDAARRYQRTKTMVHIAGHPIQVGRYQRQLCAWCGATLIANDLEAIATPDGQPPRCFEPGATVQLEQEDDGRFRSLTFIAREPGEPFPDPNCVFEAEQKPRPKLTLVR